MTNVHGQTEGAQSRDCRALTLIGAGHGVSQTRKHLCDAAHAGATDSHHKDVTNAPHPRYDSVRLNHLHAPLP